MNQPAPIESTQVAEALDEKQIGGVAANVFAVSVTSFFADLSGEMIYPLIPIFLTTVLGAPVAVVGLIEGIAESTASVVKAGSGWWSDALGRRMPLVVAGYGVAVAAKLLLAIAIGWPIVLLARFVDRFGKGMRGSPRDALIADSTPLAQRGRAFGFHRSMDTAGAVIGPLLGLLLVALLRNRFRLVFAIAVVPGLLSVLALSLVREPRSVVRKARGSAASFAFRGLDRRLLLFLAASLIFSLGNSSDVFLILRAKVAGLSTTAVVMAYVLYNFVYMGAALPAGIISDRRSRKHIFMIGLLVFALVYGGFAVVHQGRYIWGLFAVYGLYIALTDGIGKALITDLAPKGQRATALGMYGMLTGFAALIASVAAGLLWDHVSTAAPFLLGAGAAILGAGILVLLPQPRTALPEGD
ncbi:MAG: MFS transporter [Dehalococcoidia bacterium]